MTPDAWLDAVVARHESTLPRVQFLKAIRALSARYVERRETIRDLLEEDGRSYASLTAGQRKLLEDARDEEAMRALLETWPRNTVSRTGAKPPIGRANPAPLQESFDDVLAQTRWGRKRTSRSA